MAGSQLLVVDGQQRLVTLFLLEAARRDQSAYLRDELPSPSPLAGLPTDVPTRRLIANSKDRPAFDAAMNGDFRDAIPREMG